MLDDLKKKAAEPPFDGRFGAMKAMLAGGFWCVVVYRFGRWCTETKLLPLKLLFKPIYFVLFYLVQALFGVSVQAYAKIGRRFVITRTGNVFVVAEHIGDDFTVSPGVTIGNVRGSKRLPIIGNNVYIEPGAKILGEVTVGDNVVIRANSLVLKDVPAGSVVMGNPGRVVKVAEGGIAPAAS